MPVNFASLIFNSCLNLIAAIAGEQSRCSVSTAVNQPSIPGIPERSLPADNQIVPLWRSTTAPGGGCSLGSSLWRNSISTNIGHLWRTQQKFLRMKWRFGAREHIAAWHILPTIAILQLHFLAGPRPTIGHSLQDRCDTAARDCAKSFLAIMLMF